MEILFFCVFFTEVSTLLFHLFILLLLWGFFSESTASKWQIKTKLALLACRISMGERGELSQLLLSEHMTVICAIF